MALHRQQRGAARSTRREGRVTCGKSRAEVGLSLLLHCYGVSLSLTLSSPLSHSPLDLTLCHLLPLLKEGKATGPVSRRKRVGGAPACDDEGPALVSGAGQRGARVGRIGGGDDNVPQRLQTVGSGEEGEQRDREREGEERALRAALQIDEAQGRVDGGALKRAHAASACDRRDIQREQRKSRERKRRRRRRRRKKERQRRTVPSVGCFLPFSLSLSLPLCRWRCTERSTRAP